MNTIDIILAATSLSSVHRGFRTQGVSNCAALKSLCPISNCRGDQRRPRFVNKYIHGFRSFSVAQRQEMRIATLQFAPRLGDVEGNIQRANDLLKNGKSLGLAGQTLPIGIGLERLRPDVLVLPELALTGMYMRDMCQCPLIRLPVVSSDFLTGLRVQLPFIGSNQTLSRALRHWP